jgi:hypothetical protein
MKKGAYSAAEAQKSRLNDYINHLQILRSLTVKQARGAGARAGGQQNPLAVYQALNQAAAEAGAPMDAEIGKALQGSNNIENTLNSLISKAGDAQTALANIQKHTQQQSSQGSGGGGASAGGQLRAGGGGRQGPGQNLDLQGKPRPLGSSEESGFTSKADRDAKQQRMQERQANLDRGLGYTTDSELPQNSGNAGGRSPFYNPPGTFGGGGDFAGSLNYTGGRSPTGPGQYAVNTGGNFLNYNQDPLQLHGSIFDNLTSSMAGASKFGIGGDNFNSSHLNFNVPQWDDNNPFGGTGGGPSYSPAIASQSQYQGGNQGGGFEPAAQSYGQFPQTTPWQAATDWNSLYNAGADAIQGASNWWD